MLLQYANKVSEFKQILMVNTKLEPGTGFLKITFLAIFFESGFFSGG
jgi:hypothetical protein